MDTHPDHHDGPEITRPVNRRSRTLLIIGAVTLVLILAAVIIPCLRVSPIARHEANAVGSLRSLANLEAQYAAAHPSQGFTCEFAQLKMEGRSDGEQPHESFLFSDSFEGYKFSLIGCEVDRKGVVIRFKATAVPLLPGKTGFRAFCTDQTGELQFGVNESPGSCRPLSSF
jgi:hypothetical protein